MNRELAEKIASVATQSSSVLDSFLYELKDQLEPAEYKLYCQKFGKIMGETLFQVLNPIWKEYPDLLPEKMGGTYKTNDEHYKNIYKLVSSQANQHGS